MDLICDVRLSDSPFVDTIWRSHSESRAASFLSMADSHWGMVVTRHRGRSTLTVRGPETKATPSLSLEDADLLGILFKPGAFMPGLPPQMVMDRRDLDLPQSTTRTFRLNSSAWEFPNYENADTFVAWLAKDGLLAFDPVVGDALGGQQPETSVRTVQRRFLQATGLTQGAMYQIDRARDAVILLKQGVSILDTVDQAGYFDQPHLTRSLKRLIGLTPAQIINQNRPERLSFLYKTVPADEARIKEPGRNNVVNIPKL